MTHFIQKNILWIDGGAAALVGLIILLLCSWFTNWYGMPFWFVAFLGTTNLVYASYSLRLALAKSFSLAAIKVLVAGNAFWAILCAGFIVYFFESSSIWGKFFLGAEGVFVILLAIIEWRCRYSLAGVTDDGQTRGM
ncbi:hypothetical protein [Marinomonas epiphytica]